MKCRVSISEELYQDYDIQFNNENIFYETNERNVVEASIHDKDGNHIAKKTIVLLFFSRSGAIGFAQELIRLAMNYEEGKQIRLSNKDKNQQMGVYLEEESADLLITCKDLGSIYDYFEK